MALYLFDRQSEVLDGLRNGCANFLERSKAETGNSAEHDILTKIAAVVCTTDVEQTPDTVDLRQRAFRAGGIVAIHAFLRSDLNIITRNRILQLFRGRALEPLPSDDPLMYGKLATIGSLEHPELNEHALTLRDHYSESSGDEEAGAYALSSVLLTAALLDEDEHRLGVQTAMTHLGAVPATIDWNAAAAELFNQQ